MAITELLRGSADGDRKASRKASIQQQKDVTLKISRGLLYFVLRINVQARGPEVGSLSELGLGNAPPARNPTLFACQPKVLIISPSLHHHSCT